MDYLSWALINGPLSIICFIINVFYIFCMVRPLHGESIKQPLKLLLSSLIGSTVVYIFAVCGVFFSQAYNEQNGVAELSLYVSLGCLSISVSSSVWLNFFYYTQIVPARGGLFVWIKRNVKPVVFVVLLGESICTLLDFSLSVVVLNLNDYELNATSTAENASLYDPPGGDFQNQRVDITVIKVTLQRSRFYISFVVMMASSGATVLYLSRHIRHMLVNGLSLSSAGLSSQVRVTVTGILQCLLYFSFAVWREYAFAAEHDMTTFISPYVRSTAVSLYMLGTTLNLGAGQSVFRQRAADVWGRAGQWCRSLQQG
ncbi:taste receptor type 2 member 1-like [Fundulus heteroclitus]|uniref:taste receptor type 2 member 1-like n=1 Tax=Fundulus heteroclitus TaxID=8078 RepID=UPI00165A3352|nr:taste receptor type 2 member 1-like [Fundulus heteroclitus]